MKIEEMLAKANQAMSELEADYKKIKSKAKLATTDLEIDYKMKIYELRQKLDELGVELQKYGETGKGSWRVLAEGFDKAAGELKKAFKESLAKFKE